MVDEDVADELGLIDEDDVLPAELVVRDAAVGGGEVLEEQGGVRRIEEAADDVEGQVKREARRKAVGTAVDHGPCAGTQFAVLVAVLITVLGRSGCCGHGGLQMTAGHSRERQTTTGSAGRRSRLPTCAAANGPAL